MPTNADPFAAYFAALQTEHQSGKATEQAAAMVDRFNQLFLRTLRQLRDLRRYAPQVTIQNAGQVNIASGQQMNLAKMEAPEPLDE